MRQSDYNIGEARRRLQRRMRNFLLALAVEVDTAIVLKRRKRYHQARFDVKQLARRSWHISTTTFNINVFTEEECLRYFRFKKDHITVVMRLTGWETGRTVRNRYVCNPFTAVCIMMRKLAFPVRWSDMEYMFGMRSSALCEVHWEIVESLTEKQGHLLATLRSSLVHSRAAMYARAVEEAGSPLDNCIGFIDCTKMQMCRPGGSGSNQRTCYSGHKRFHCLIYQSITTPDGLLLYMYGPEVGRRHDLTLYRESGLNWELEEKLVVDGKQYCIYGDAAYMLRPWLQVGFRNAQATMEEASYNAAMSAVRTAVEWSYKDLKQMWASQDFKRALRLRQAPIALLYRSSALLWNFRCCLLYGGQVTSYFVCPPPTLDQYINCE